MVSVFTAAHETGRDIVLPLLSLLSQTSQDWEWVVVDDSEDWVTADQLEHLDGTSAIGGRLRLHRHVSGGSIGSSKAAAAALCVGDVLVELDHDDELRPSAVADLSALFTSRPDIDFAYSDWIDRVESTSGGFDDRELYPSGWGLGFGSYAYDLLDGSYAPVAQAPAVTTETVRHIVSMPNHVRAWRRTAYHRIGGHDPAVPIGDDYELLVRTFLSCTMARLPRPLYVQHHAAFARSASRKRNAEIQELVARVASASAEAMDDRCRELGMMPNTAEPLPVLGPISVRSERYDPAAEDAKRRGEPLVSVVVPSAGPTSRTTIESILAQRYDNLEVLVVAAAEASTISDLAAEIGDERLRYCFVEGAARLSARDLVAQAENTMTRSSCVLHVANEPCCLRPARHVVRRRGDGPGGVGGGWSAAGAPT